MAQKATYLINACLFFVLLTSGMFMMDASAETEKAVATEGITATMAFQRSGLNGAGESDSCTAYFRNTMQILECRDGEVPFPAAIWLFLVALAAFVGLSNKRKV